MKLVCALISSSSFVLHIYTQTLVVTLYQHLFRNSHVNEKSANE